MTDPAHGNVARASELARRDAGSAAAAGSGGAACRSRSRSDGESIRTAALASWDRVSRPEQGSRAAGPNARSRGASRHRQLEVRCVLVTYQDFPTVEWTVHLENGRLGETPLAAHILGFDVQLRRSGSASSCSTTARARTNGPDSYEPRSTTLGANPRHSSSPRLQDARLRRCSRISISYSMTAASSSRSVGRGSGWHGSSGEHATLRSCHRRPTAHLHATQAGPRSSAPRWPSCSSTQVMSRGHRTCGDAGCWRTSPTRRGELTGCDPARDHGAGTGADGSQPGGMHRRVAGPRDRSGHVVDGRGLVSL